MLDREDKAKEQRKSSRKNLTLLLVVMVVAAFCAHFLGYGDAGVLINGFCCLVGALLYYRMSTEQAKSAALDGHLWSLKLTTTVKDPSPTPKKRRPSGISIDPDVKTEAEREDEGTHYFMCGAS
jgi:hypothetical protein